MIIFCLSAKSEGMRLRVELLLSRTIFLMHDFQLLVNYLIQDNFLMENPILSPKHAIKYLSKQYMANAS